MNSITMNLYYTGENGNAQKFAQEMESSGTAAAIRAEEGNLKYAYFVSMDDPETVLLMWWARPAETWSEVWPTPIWRPVNGAG